MHWTSAILLGLGGYLLGSVPTGYIVARLARGVDIRDVGSGNVGALNTYQQVGPWGGVLVLLADAGKGALAVVVPGLVGAPGWTIFLTTPLLVAGHNWPAFLNFRGGKGAAAILGVSLALVPMLTLIALAPTLLVMAAVRNVVLGAAFGFVLLNSLLLATRQSTDLIALCVSLTVLVTATYLVSIRERLTACIRARQWRELFTELA